MKKEIRLLCLLILSIVFFLLGKPFLKENIEIQEDVFVGFQGNQPEERRIGKELQLERGLYQVEVTYEADSTNHYITAVSEKEPDYLGCDKILLERAKNVEVFQVWVSRKVDDFQVLGCFAGTGTWSVSKIKVQQRTLGKVRDLFCGLVFCVFLVLAMEAVLRGCLKDREKIAVFGGLAFITILVSLPLFREGVYIGHDSGFHLNRIEGLSQGLVSGQLPVRIQPNWLHEYGYAVSVFYGDTLLYIPAALRLLGFSAQEAYECFIFIVNAATAVVSYFCWKKMFDNRKIALFISFLYTFSLYRLVNVYTRAAVGEYCAMIFLPVVSYGFWCILGSTESKKNWYPLAIGFTGLLQTHMLSCEITGIFSVILCMVCMKRVICRENFLALVKAALSTLVINLWYLVPFLDYMIRENLKINKEVLSGMGMQSSGISFRQFFGVFLHGTGIRDAGGLKEGMPLGIGLGFQIVVILICYVLLKYRKKTVMWKLLSVTAAMGVFALCCATEYFPWDVLMSLGMGFLASIQFPWRFLGTAVLCFCTGAGAALWILQKNAKSAVINVCISFIIAASVLSSGYMLLTFMESAEIENCHEQRDAPYYVSGGEYLPADIIFEEEAFHIQKPVGFGVKVTGYEKHYNKVIAVCENKGNEDGVLQVPLLLYRGYQAYDSLTKETFPMLRTESGMTGIILPPGYQGTVRMEFQEPFFWRLAEIVSILGMVCMVIKRWKKRRQAEGERDNYV